MKRLTDDIEHRIHRTCEFVDFINYFFDEHPDGLNNNKEFWSRFHEYVKAYTIDWIEVEDILRDTYPQNFRDREPWLTAGSEHLKKAVYMGKPLTKPDVPSKNTATLKAWFNIRDFINDITNYVPPKRIVAQEPSVFENLFERA